MANRREKSGISDRFNFGGGAPKSLQTVTTDMKLKNTCSLEGKLWQPRQLIKKQRHHITNKGPYSQNYGFSSSHLQMWELDHKEGWVLKNWCFWIVVLEKTLKSPLNRKEIKPVNPKGNQPWVFIGRTDAEAPILWTPDVKSSPIGKKTLMLGKFEGRRKREWQRIRWLYGIIDSMGMSLSKLLEIAKDREHWRSAIHEVAESDMT